MLALLSCALSTVRTTSHTFSTSSNLLLRFVRLLLLSNFRTSLCFVLFLGKFEKIVLGDPGTPANVKVIAGDCQRLPEIVDDSTFKQLQFSLKVAPQNGYLSEASNHVAFQ